MENKDQYFVPFRGVPKLQIQWVGDANASYEHFRLIAINIIRSNSA